MDTTATLDEAIDQMVSEIAKGCPPLAAERRSITDAMRQVEAWKLQAERHEQTVEWLKSRPVGATNLGRIAYWEGRAEAARQMAAYWAKREQIARG